MPPRYCTRTVTPLTTKMDFFANIVHRIIRVGVYVASVALLGVILLTVVNVITRRFGWAIPGGYELTELIMPMTIGFALAYTAITKGHIAMNLLVSRLPQRIQTVIESFDSVIGLGMLAALIWAGAGLLHERWLVEVTDTFDIPFAPFRTIWLVGLAVFCLVLLLDLLIVLRERVRK